jgi:hypothetical protein
MKRLLFVLTVLLFSVISNGQEPSLIFSRIVKETPDTVFCTLAIWQKGLDGTYEVKKKEFADQTMISLSSGEYVLQYSTCDSILFIQTLKLDDEPATVILNLILESTSFATFDFSRAVFVSPEIYNFVNRKEVYIEF